MTQKIILKSTHLEEYPDLEVECKVIPNNQIGNYLATIPAENKFYAYKSAPVKARKGTVGETIHTTLKTMVDGKEYILQEETGVVKTRTYTKDGETITAPDVVVTNYASTSNEEYVVKHEKFMKTYIPTKEDEYVPAYDSRLLTQVDENIIIMTAWGAPAVCLAGSYIVTYNEADNDYNTIEKGAFNSTYTREETKTLRKKPQ